MAPFAILDLGLLVFALRRPWPALVLLLGGLPLNGFITQVLAGLLDLDATARLALAAWHDALLVGIVLAAGLALLRGERPRLTLVESLVLLVGVIGLIYIVVSPVRLTAVYAYRTIYEPPFLFAALLVLSRTVGMPAWLPTRAATALVAMTTVSAAFTWLQVYVLKFRYIQTFYTDPGDQIHHSYIASGIGQPRGIGTFTSPNEFGAALAISITLLLIPGALRIPGWLRTTLLGSLGLALLLTFSRSGWLGTALAALILLWLGRDQLPSRAAVMARLGDWRFVLRHAPQAVAVLVLAVAVFVTSGAQELVTQTVTGRDPSASNRPASIRQGLTVLRENPLGLGLGTAGPKASRFGETEGRPRILTEAWYLVYAIQVGLVGFAAFVALVLVILQRLWPARGGPWALASLAIGVGLGVGAVFIPIIEDPTVWTPLWTIVAFGLAVPVAVRAATLTER